MGGKRVTTEIYMEDVKEIHKDKGYEYKEDWEYTSSKCPIEIKCPTHGWWTTKAYSHRGMKSGCPRCAEEFRDSRCSNLHYERLGREANKLHKKHNERDDYVLKRIKDLYGDSLEVLSECFPANCFIKLKCKVHDIVYHAHSRHLWRNNQCSLCTEELIEQHRLKTTKTLDEVIDLFKDVHGDRYDYSLVKYKHTHSKVKIICREHGVFLMTPRNHYAAYQSGCPDCAVNGYKRSLPGILYYLKIPCRHRNYYKIGITNNTVKQRFSRDSGRYLIIKEWYYEDGGEAYDEEQRILKEFSEYKCSIEDIDFDWVSGGTTEMFTRDVLNLDNMYAEYLK